MRRLMRRALASFADLLGGLALVAAVDVLLFHHGLYFPLLRPDSYSGRVEAAQRRFAAVSAAATQRQLIIMSNSSAGACVDEAQLEAVLTAGGLDLGVINLAEGGATARGWYKLLGTAELEARATALVVLGVHPAALDRTETKDADLEIVKTRLDLVDVATLPWSYGETERRLRVASVTVFRTPLFREDLVDFVAAPQTRLTALAAARGEEIARLATGWRRRNASVATLSTARLDAEGNLDRDALDPWILADAQLPGLLEGRLRLQRAGKAQPAMVIEPGQAAMLARAVEMLGLRGIPVVVAVTPRSPIRLAGRPLGALEALVVQLRRRGARVVLYHDQQLLDEVEQLEHFRDMLHVNAGGARIYTDGLAAFVLAAVARGELDLAEGGGEVGAGREAFPAASARF